MKNLIKTSLISSAICLVHVGCASASPHHKHAAPAANETSAIAATGQTNLVDGANHKGYLKPGASVALQHDFSGKIDAGELGEMTVDLVMQPKDATVSVYYTATDGLNLLSGGEQRTIDVSASDFDNGSSPLGSQTLRFRAAVDGRYYINAFIDVTHPNGQKLGRVLTMPVYVGTAPAKVKSQKIIKQKSGRSIIVMPAKETVIN